MTMAGASEEASLSSPATSSSPSVFEIFKPLLQNVPSFPIASQEIDIYHTPQEFLGVIKEGIVNAQQRIVLAALYLGTANEEQEIINLIKTSLEKNSDLRVDFLFDYLRGHRGSPNTTTLINGLFKTFPDRITSYYYHTPELRGLSKQLLPAKFNEGVGLAHMKIYMFDNDLVLSGANLSDSYFKNRQDRCFRFRNQPQLCQYFKELVDLVGSFSFRAQLSGKPEIDSSNKSEEKVNMTPPKYNPMLESRHFKEFASHQTRAFLDKWVQSTSSPKLNAEKDSLLIPLIQMGNINVRQDQRMMSALFKMFQSDLARPWRVVLTSGYFNFTDEYEREILKSRANIDIICASPKASGFYGARGVLGWVPGAYSYIEQKFYNKIRSPKTISVHEYYRPDWTYHAKGMWIYLNKSSLPSLTTIGSPNFGHRSVERDLEAQVVLMTENESLKQKLGQEVKAIQSYTTPVTEATFRCKERQVPRHVRWAAKLLQTFL